MFSKDTFTSKRFPKQNIRSLFLCRRLSDGQKNGFYREKPFRKAHDREVLTNYVGELVQHDTSIPLWAPEAQTQWYLITSIDACR